MGTVLRRVSAVQWGKLHGASGTAEAIPGLLATLAWGEDDAAGFALDELQFSICRDGLAVVEVTEHVIPFLWEIAEVRSGVVCKGIIQLLDSILLSDGWGRAYAAVSQKDRVKYADSFAWEKNSHGRICNGLNLVRALRDSSDVDVARAASLLEAHIMDFVAKANRV